MSKPFDPYREWLGVDVGTATPSYYQLLRISSDEGNLETISNAAERAMNRVRAARPGKHADEWTQLLDTLNSAKTCLLDPTLRSRYDAQLLIPQSEAGCPQTLGGTIGQMLVECSRCQRQWVIPKDSLAERLRCESCNAFGALAAPPISASTTVLTPEEVAEEVPREDAIETAHPPSKYLNPTMAVGCLFIIAAAGVVALAFAVAQDDPSTENREVVNESAIRNDSRTQRERHEPPIVEADSLAKPVTNTAEAVIERIEPSVVAIQTTTVGPEAGLEFEGLGSGFLFGEDGLIVTNYHVIEGAKNASVTFSDGSRATVQGFVAISPGKDLALIRIDSWGIDAAPLQLAESPPAKGESVLTFGSPVGFSGTVSEGIVSALRQSAGVVDVIGEAPFRQMGYDLDARWIQTTAAISAGNSGGPLVSLEAEVVGVNTWGWPKGESLNFAVSASHLTDLLVGSGATQPLSELPRPRETSLVASWEREALSAREAASLAMGEVAVLKEIAATEKERVEEIKRTREAVVAAAERARESVEIQEQLTRLNDLMNAVRVEISAVEREGTGLTSQRNRVLAAGKAVFVSGNQLRGRIAGYQRRIGNLTYAINNRMIDGVIYNPPRRDADFVIMASQRNILLLELENLKADARSLEGQFAGLDAEARALGSQIAYKAAQRNQLFGALEDLQTEYERLSSLRK
ncbi:MAG: trypsin-like peptidase domain-containing protein [Pirellulaceae bacterium]